MNMKYIAYVFIFLAVTFLVSCEKVIDVKVNEAAKKYVIEGVLTDQAGSCQVTITQTKGFNEDNDFTGINNAKVTITDDAGAVSNLTQTSAGLYESSLKGVPAKTYTLQVSINGEVFTAVSKMPLPISIDSLYINEVSFFSKTSKLVNVRYSDPVTLGNNYRFVQYINRIKNKGIYIQNDDLTNGRVSTATFYNRDGDINKGDTVKVELQCIDPAIYKYWFSLSQSSTGETESASPANPVSNITGGALGYFSAHTVRTKSVIAK